MYFCLSWLTFCAVYFFCGLLFWVLRVGFVWGEMYSVLTQVSSRRPKSYIPMKLFYTLTPWIGVLFSVPKTPKYQHLYWYLGRLGGVEGGWHETNPNRYRRDIDKNPNPNINIFANWRTFSGIRSVVFVPDPWDISVGMLCQFSNLSTGPMNPKP